MTPSSFEPEALQEIVEATVRYGLESAAAARRFRVELDHALNLARGLPNAFPRVATLARRSIRQVKLHRFPYFLVYLVKPREIRVLAVAHTSRRPLYWRDRAP